MYVGGKWMVHTWPVRDALVDYRLQTCATLVAQWWHTGDIWRVKGWTTGCTREESR